MNAWDDLPNAKHINRVLDSFNRNPKAWDEARGETTDWTSYAAWNSEFNAAWDTTLNSSRKRAKRSVMKVVCGAAWDAILALIAYDDIAHMLDSTPDELRVLIALGDGRAILMLPAAIVFSEETVS